jgi:hypothetical protein
MLARNRFIGSVAAAQAKFTEKPAGRPLKQSAAA